MSDVPIDPSPPGAHAPEPGRGPLSGSTCPGGPAAAASAGGIEPDGRESTAAPPASDAGPAAPDAVTIEEHAGVHRGRLLRVGADHVLVSLDDGRQGTVPLIEFAGQPLPREGDDISVIIERLDPGTGWLVLSKRQADEFTFWQLVQPGEVLEGVVTGMNKGGLDIDIGGARAFLPASQVDVHRMKDISTLIGEHVCCVVTQVDRTTRDLVVSRRRFIEQEHQQERDRKLADLIEGENRTGTVSNVTDYGAFVDLDGIHGLVHLNDLSWSRIGHPSEIVRKGQQVEVRILKVNHQTGRVSLGLKQTRPDPWENIDARYAEGRRIKARVARLADFGAFLQLEEGVDALLPLSEMSWSRRVNHPSEVVQVGDDVETVVLKVDAARKRISVGLRQTVENPWTSVETRFPVDGTVKGTVCKIMDFGAFVELAPGVEGLIHISELSDRRVAAVSDVVQEGQEVEVRVIKIDLEAQRISLSMRSRPPEKRPVADARPDAARPGKPRKKHLRGGLASHFQWW